MKFLLGIQMVAVGLKHCCEKEGEKGGIMKGVYYISLVMSTSHYKNFCSVFNLISV